MKIVVAPNAFKGSLSAREASLCIHDGVKALLPEATIIEMPLADGGDGTMDVIADALNARLVEATVLNPLGEPVRAAYAISDATKTGIIEMAKASGLALIPAERRNPLVATSYGTGQLITTCLDAGCVRLIIGLGGSATVDGGAGMAQALGAKLLDSAGNSLDVGGGELHKLHTIDLMGLDPRLKDVEVIAACDTENMLLGPQGAVRVYSPQKGASAADVALLEQNLTHYANVIHEQLTKDIRSMPMAGAAGGLGAGLFSFANARLQPGIEVILSLLRAEDIVRDAALVITGEGKLDGQSIFGKAPIGIAKLAQRFDVPVVAIVGWIGDDAPLTLEYGISGYECIVKAPISLEESVQQVRQLLAQAAERTMRLLRLGSQMNWE